MANLKPCPFCGGNAVFHNCAELENETAAVIYNGKIGIHCKNCGIATLPFNDKDMAEMTWNKRAGEEQQKEIDQLKTIITNAQSAIEEIIKMNCR